MAPRPEAPQDADANAPGDEMPDGEASSDADLVAAVAAGFEPDRRETA